MFTVIWDDREGNRQQRTFDRLEDAKFEAETLKEKFDFVEISDGQATGRKGDQKMKKQNDYTLHVSANEIFNLMLACTLIVCDAQKEQRDPNIDNTRQEILVDTIKMWQSIHDKLKTQLDEQDNQDA